MRNVEVPLEEVKVEIGSAGRLWMTEVKMRATSEKSFRRYCILRFVGELLFPAISCL